MKTGYKVTRSFLMILLALLIVVPAGLYIALSLEGVQNGICRRAEKELSALLDSKVDIDHISITPFNRVTLHGVTVEDDNGNPALSVERLGAGIRLGSLIFSNKIEIVYAEIIGMDARLSRDSASAPLNISRMIAALSPKDRKNKATDFNLAANVLVIRKSSVSYDVLSVPCDSSRFSPSHIRISDLKADILIPSIRRDNYDVEIRRLSMREHSGFQLVSLSGNFHVGKNGTSIGDLTVELPETKVGFEDITTEYSSLDSLKSEWRNIDVRLATTSGSYVSLPDLKAFVPALADFNEPLSLELLAYGSPDSFTLDRIGLSYGDKLSVSLEGEMENATVPENMNLEISELTAKADCETLAGIIAKTTPLTEKARRLLSNIGTVKIDGNGSGTRHEGNMEASITIPEGKIMLDAGYTGLGSDRPLISGSVETDGLNAAELTAGLGKELESLSFLTFAGEFSVKPTSLLAGEIQLEIPRIDYKEHSYSDIKALASINGNKYTGEISLDNPDVMLIASAEAVVTDGEKMLDFTVDMRDVNLASLNLDVHNPDHRLSLTAEGKLEGPDADRISGYAMVRDIKFVDGSGNGLKINEVSLNSRMNGDGEGVLTLTSDILDGRVDGQYRFSRLPAMARNLAATVFPRLIGREPQWPADIDDYNNFLYSFSVKETKPLEALLKLPVKVIYPISVFGRVDESARMLTANIDAPYLQQGDKLIENTSMQLRVATEPGDDRNTAEMSFSTLLPTKKGPMSLMVETSARDDAMDTRLEWNVKRERMFKGEVKAFTRFSRNDDGPVTAVDFNRSTLVFNDTAWVVEPSRIVVAGKEATVEGFRVGHDNQFVTIAGKASASAADSLTVTLRDVSLDYIFETLDISNAQFGGNATGRFYASELFSKQPRAYTPDLFVKQLKYNGCVLGDTRLQAKWHPENGAVGLHADISQNNGGKSTVDGAIMALNDSLDLHFNAEKIPIGFLQYFMSAFASEVDGFASGKARLWGSFKNIDMTGDVYGEDVRIKLDFTNTSYLTTDSVFLRPGRIDIPGITIRDTEGHTARLSGWLTHKCFHEPEFRFNVTDARNLLVYDVKESPDARWYGHVFGNGTASVTGHPGVVGINVNMRTTQGSNFTFVLSDALNAQEYNFLTFRDSDRAKKDSIAALDPTPALVRELRARLAKKVSEESSTVYGMDITVDVTPEALVTLVMDPVGGDRIKAYGAGSLRMTYDSANEDLRMFGAYTLQRGYYNFTLQDIILKDFTIRDGSTITFHGDPYAAQLDINAAYSVNANLSDLDESFLEDRELNRTNVPVNAMMHVTGDMRQPDINFDLEFPTLTQDTYRKVRSIVSTEEMMNRQIIYLLALNRFYTPDYMNATRGNELVSVASSTLSSQLGSILGQLSDKWNIAPNFRSDRGDFSDVEVDMALSSHLLNNRLILNGNFGYRDKALNNNSFIGDFDIEYLLNKSGSIRLKAYNRYNDQNYYLKSATTTQGVGVEFKREFDSMTSFMDPILKWFRGRKKKNAKKEVTDTVQTAPLTPPSPEILIESPGDTLRITPAAMTDTIKPVPPVRKVSVAKPAPGHGKIIF